MIGAEGEDGVVGVEKEEGEGEEARPASRASLRKEIIDSHLPEAISVTKTP